VFDLMLMMIAFLQRGLIVSAVPLGSERSMLNLSPLELQCYLVIAFGIIILGIIML
jgi:hypothetical protein